MLLFDICSFDTTKHQLINSSVFSLCAIAGDFWSMIKWLVKCQFMFIEVINEHTRTWIPSKQIKFIVVLLKSKHNQVFFHSVSFHFYSFIVLSDLSASKYFFDDSSNSTDELLSKFYPEFESQCRHANVYRLEMLQICINQWRWRFCLSWIMINLLKINHIFKNKIFWWHQTWILPLLNDSLSFVWLFWYKAIIFGVNHLRYTEATFSITDLFFY